MPAGVRESLGGKCARWAAAVLLLPVNVVLVIPAALYAFFPGSGWPSLHELRFWSGGVLFVLGFLFASWTAVLFARYGEGTAAPWDPPLRFVVRGPYRHVRNPMISAVLAMLAAESLFFFSEAIFVWFVFFVLLNAVYIPLVEEPQLKRRFGADYENYMRSVRRWIPSFSPYGLNRDT